MIHITQKRNTKPNFVPQPQASTARTRGGRAPAAANNASDPRWNNVASPRPAPPLQPQRQHQVPVSKQDVFQVYNLPYGPDYVIFKNNNEEPREQYKVLPHSLGFVLTHLPSGNVFHVQNPGPPNNAAVNQGPSPTVSVQSPTPVQQQTTPSASPSWSQQAAPTFAAPSPFSPQASVATAFSTPVIHSSTPSQSMGGVPSQPTPPTQPPSIGASPGHTGLSRAFDAMSMRTNTNSNNSFSTPLGLSTPPPSHHQAVLGNSNNGTGGGLGFLNLGNDEQVSPMDVDAETVASNTDVTMASARDVVRRERYAFVKNFDLPRKDTKLETPLAITAIKKVGVLQAKLKLLKNGDLRDNQLLHGSKLIGVRTILVPDKLSVCQRNLMCALGFAGEHSFDGYGETRDVLGRRCKELAHQWHRGNPGFE